MWMLPLAIAIVMPAAHPGATGTHRTAPQSQFYVSAIQPLFTAKCLSCHGAAKTSKLDLRTRKGMLAGGTHGPAIVPGKPEQSLLWKHVTGQLKPQMPPSKPLEPKEMDALRKWIAEGAVGQDPANPTTGQHWSFVPVKRPPIPTVENQKSKIENPIDAFVLSRLRQSGLALSPPADRRTLIRRVTLDLHGLLPTPAEVDAFVNDRSPRAYEDLVDRLLASPRYGERWARHWLDLARYAESEGFKSDELRPNAWRYRDYVIKSLNADKPYDRFIKEQLAGDELYPDDMDARVATGFCRHWADESNARNLRQRRQEILNDVTEVTAGSLLGLTMGCARCHDHKYDPIPQRDYYRFQSFFAAMRPRDDMPLLSGAKLLRHRESQARWENVTKDIRAEMTGLEDAPHQKVYFDKKRKFPEEVQEAIDIPGDKRTSLQWLLFRKAEPQLAVSQTEMLGAMKPEPRKRWDLLSKQLEQFKGDRPDPLPAALGITDIGGQAPMTHVLATGVYDAERDEVTPAFPGALGAPLPSIQPIQRRNANSNDDGLPLESTGRRAALAEWLASPANPLTARVMVNRIWQHHFGRGLVNTPSDFGATGERPSHPELLDWLAAVFATPASASGFENQRSKVENGMGWRMKHMHRLMVTSAAYRQSAVPSARATRLDPDNRLLSHFGAQRLEGEVLRDCLLQSSGLLNEKAGGPSVMPDLPEGLTTRGWWKETADTAERNRRSIYVMVKRNLRYPFFTLFDQPDTHEPCARREVTTTGLQALTLLNDAFVQRCATALAARVQKEAAKDPANQVAAAYRLALCRKPTTDELSEGIAFISKGQDAFIDFCQALMSSSEFVYVE